VFRDVYKPIENGARKEKVDMFHIKAVSFRALHCIPFSSGVVETQRERRRRSLTSFSFLLFEGVDIARHITAATAVSTFRHFLLLLLLWSFCR
jgi:hypothetical protein